MLPRTETIARIGQLAVTRHEFEEIGPQVTRHGRGPGDTRGPATTRRDYRVFLKRAAPAYGSAITYRIGIATRALRWSPPPLRAAPSQEFGTQPRTCYIGRSR
jgi:hypothetical protein